MSNPCPECGVDVNELTAEIDDLRIKLELAKDELIQLREFKQSVNRVLAVLQRMPPRASGRCVPPSHAGSTSGSPDEPTQQDGAREVPR